MEKNGVIILAQALESYMEGVGGPPSVGTNDGVVVAYFDCLGVGGEVDKALEVGVMEEVENGKVVVSGGETLGEKMKIGRTKTVIVDFVEEQSIPVGVEEHGCKD
jgi:hypothetical protein